MKAMWKGGPLLPSPIEVAPPQATTTQSERGQPAIETSPTTGGPTYSRVATRYQSESLIEASFYPRARRWKCCAENATESKNLRFLIAHTCQIHYGRSPKTRFGRGSQILKPAKTRHR